MFNTAKVDNLIVGMKWKNKYYNINGIVITNEEYEGLIPEEDEEVPVVTSAPDISVDLLIEGTQVTATVTLNNESEVTKPVIYSYYVEGELKYEGENTTTTFTCEHVSSSEYNIEIVATSNDGKSKTVYDLVGVCFVGGTKVLTENGLKNIEEIQVGEKVYSKNLETNIVELKEVTSVFENISKNLCNVYVEDKVITSTPSHPYYVVDKGWTRAGELKESDKLVDTDGNIINVSKVEKIDKEQDVKVYNLSVKDYMNYFVSEYELLVHNVGCEE